MPFDINSIIPQSIYPEPPLAAAVRRRRQIPVDAVEQIQLPEQEQYAPQEPLPEVAPELPPQPEVEPGVLSKIGNTALSGLSIVGNALDLVPSMLRDVATLDNPFDQILTPFSAENRNTGRDVLTKWGATNPNDPDKWEAADFLGFGVDVLSGLPLSGIGVGGRALTEGGKALSRAGLLDDLMRVAPAATPGKLSARISTTVDDLIKPRLGEQMNPLFTAGSKEAMERQGRLMDAASGMGIDDITPLLQQKVGGVADLRLPFMPSNVVGTGGTALKYANKLDEGLRKIHDFEIPGTGVAPIARAHELLDSTIGEAQTAMGRRLMRPLMADRKDAMYAARGDVADAAQELLDNGGQFADNSVDSSRAIRRVMEGYDAPQNAGVQGMHDKARAMLDQMVPDANEWGVKLDTLQELFTKYFPRRMTKEMNVGVGRGSKVVNAADDFAEMREPFLRNLGEGTDTVFKLTDDPNIKALIDADAPVRDIELAIGNHFNDVYAKTGKMTSPNYVDAAGNNLGDRYNVMARWLKEMNPETRASGVFGNHPLQDLLGRTTAANESLSTAKNILTNLADDTVLAEAKRLAGKNTDTVRLKDVLNKVGLDSNYSFDSAGNIVGGNALRKYLTLKGVPPGAITKDMLDAAGNTAIPSKFADDINRVSELFNGPVAAKGLVKLADDFTSLFKVGVLTTPRFHVRNLVSGQTQNALAGMWSRRSTSAMQNIMTGKGADIGKVPIIAEELRRAGLANTPENAADMFRKLAYRFNMVPKFEQQTMSRAGLPQGATIDDIIGSMPGGTFRGRGTPFAPIDQAKEVLKGGKGNAGTTWNPTQATWRGLNDATENTFAPVAASDIAGHYVEGMNRGAPFLELLMKGVHPKEAARRVLDAQFDYGSGAGSQTKFSREVMTRVFPFWKFCVPESHEALTQSGWKKHTEISEGDLIMALNPDNGVLEWTPVQAINVFDHDGEINELHYTRKTRSITFQCTDEHAWYVHRRKQRTIRNGSVIQKVRNEYGTIQRVLATELVDGDKIPATGDFRSEDSILSDRHAAILGWLLGDGYYRWRGSHCEMLVYQSPKKYLQEIIDLLGTSPRNPHPATGVVAVPVSLADSNAIKEVLLEYGDDPRKIVARLSRSAAEAMKNTLFMAEGTTWSKTGNRHFCQCPELHPDILEAFQMLCVMTGDVANIAVAGCTIRKNKYYMTRRKNRRKVAYSGKVWCPTTKYGTWLMRHNGCVIVTGNSKGAVPYTLRQLYEAPGGPMAQTVRTTGLLGAQDATTPDHVASSTSIPLGTGDDGTRKYITGLGLMHEAPIDMVFGSNPILKQMSSMNPLLQAPLQLGTKESFFQEGPMGGRDLSAMDPPLGRIASNVASVFGRESTDPITFPGSDALEFVISNSPLSGIVNTGRTMSDTRKGIFDKAANLATGIRVTDVSPAAQDAVLRERIQQLQRELGGRDFDTVTINAERLARMSPSQRAAYEELKRASNTLTKRAKQRKAVKELMVK